MKTITTLVLFIVFSRSIYAQCPSAGQDSAASYCPNEFFDLAELRSSDADTNGVFIDPSGDTMANTVISLPFPGIYNFRYQVSDTNCPVDTAKYVITIVSFCWGELTENTLESNALIRYNPVNDLLTLYDSHYDLLEIYETSGRRVLVFSKGQTLPDISQLHKGNYLLIHEKNGTRQFQRFIKQ